MGEGERQLYPALKALEELERRVQFVSIQVDEEELEGEAKLARIYGYFDVKNEFSHALALRAYQESIGYLTGPGARDRYVRTCHEAIEYWLRHHASRGVRDLFRDLFELEGA